MTELEEDAYTLGELTAWTRIQELATSEIGPDYPEGYMGKWVKEKAETVIALRSIALANGVAWEPKEGATWLPDIVVDLIRKLNEKCLTQPSPSGSKPPVPTGSPSPNRESTWQS